MLEQALIAHFVDWLHCLQLYRCAKAILAVRNHYLLFGGMLTTKPGCLVSVQKLFLDFRKTLGVDEIWRTWMPLCIWKRDF